MSEPLISGGNITDKVYENKNNSQPLWSDSKEQHIPKLHLMMDATFIVTETKKTGFPQRTRNILRWQTTPAMRTKQMSQDR